MPGGKPICLSPSWDRLLAFVYQNGGTFLNAAKTKSTVNTPAVAQAVNFYVGLLKSGLAGDAGEARRRLVWRGARQGEGGDRLRGQLAVPFMRRTFPNVKLQRTKDGEGQGATATSPSRSRIRWPGTRRTSRPRGQLIRYLIGKQGMKIWASKGLALPSRSDVKPVEGRAAFIADGSGRSPVAVCAALLEGDGRREQRAHGRAGGEADGPRAC